MLFARYSHDQKGIVILSGVDASRTSDPVIAASSATNIHMPTTCSRVPGSLDQRSAFRLIVHSSVRSTFVESSGMCLRQ
jgi:hypothetical protein